MPLAYSIETRDWPIVRFTPTDHLDDLEAYDATFSAVDELLARKMAFATVFDLRGVSSSAARRRRFLEWFELRRSAIERYVMAHGIIARSSVEVGIVTAYRWVAKTSIPFSAFRKPEEAEAWARAEFHRRLREREG